MTAAAQLGAALALLLAAPAPRLPAEAGARYRVELAGAPVGWAELRLRCAGDACELRWTSELRLPAGAGGGVAARSIDAAMGRDGAARAVTARVLAGGRELRAVRAGPGPAPASAAELLLALAADGERRCVRVRDEESGREGDACAVRAGERLRGDVLGEPIELVAAAGEAPREVSLPAQGARFVADPGARLPDRAPAALDTEAPLAAGASRFCGAALDPPAPPLPAGAPRRFPEGASCRERAAAYAALARAAGTPARIALGVAWDGRAFVWHAWAEVEAGGAWIPVDPSFEQAPARGPRFTLARYAEEDGAARMEAGRAILRCWALAGAGPR